MLNSLGGGKVSLNSYFVQSIKAALTQRHYNTLNRPTYSTLTRTYSTHPKATHKARTYSSNIPINIRT